MQSESLVDCKELFVTFRAFALSALLLLVDFLESGSSVSARLEAEVVRFCCWMAVRFKACSTAAVAALRAELLLWELALVVVCIEAERLWRAARWADALKEMEEDSVDEVDEELRADAVHASDWRRPFELGSVLVFAGCWGCGWVWPGFERSKLIGRSSTRSGRLLSPFVAFAADGEPL